MGLLQANIQAALPPKAGRAHHRHVELCAGESSNVDAVGVGFTREAAERAMALALNVQPIGTKPGPRRGRQLHTCTDHRVRPNESGPGRKPWTLFGANMEAFMDRPGALLKHLSQHSWWLTGGCFSRA